MGETLGEIGTVVEPDLNPPEEPARTYMIAEPSIFEPPETEYWRVHSERQARYLWIAGFGVDGQPLAKKPRLHIGDAERRPAIEDLAEPELDDIGEDRVDNDVVSDQAVFVSTENDGDVFVDRGPKVKKSTVACKPLRMLLPSELSLTSFCSKNCATMACSPYGVSTYEIFTASLTCCFNKFVRLSEVSQDSEVGGLAFPSRLAMLRGTVSDGGM